jgi:hypothetical protein
MNPDLRSTMRPLGEVRERGRGEIEQVLAQDRDTTAEARPVFQINSLRECRSPGHPRCARESAAPVT